MCSTEERKETQTTIWIGKQLPISVSKSLNLIDEPIFLYNKDSQNLIIDFVRMRRNFQDFEEAVNERMNKTFDQLNEKGKSNIFESEDECIEDSEEADISTQFLRIQKNQLIDLKQHLKDMKTLYLFLDLAALDMI